MFFEKEPPRPSPRRRRPRPARSAPRRPRPTPTPTADTATAAAPPTTTRAPREGRRREPHLPHPARRRRGGRSPSAATGSWSWRPSAPRPPSSSSRSPSPQAQLAQTQAPDRAPTRARRTHYKANYATVVRLGKAVPTDDDTRSLVVQLDAAAKRSGVDFDTINAQRAARGRHGRPPPATPVAPGRGQRRQLLGDAVQLRLHRRRSTRSATSSRGSSAS